jgi:hypothetical protein
MKTEHKPTYLITIFLAIILLLLLASCGNSTTTKTAKPTIDRTVIGKVQTIDSYADDSILYFGNNLSIDVTNSSLNNWQSGSFFGLVNTYQLQGVGMIFDNGYHEFNLINVAGGQAIIGGTK